MNLLELFDILILAFGLSMDAFAVSVCKGLEIRKVRLKHCLIVGVYFGVFQAIMPLAAYYMAFIFADFINRFGHWISLAILSSIGINMIREALEGRTGSYDIRSDKEKNNKEKNKSPISLKTMLFLGIATSLDAFAAGIPFAYIRADIFFTVMIIGSVTFLLSAAGVKIGSIFGMKLNRSAEITGGVVLIILGLKIFLEHL